MGHFGSGHKARGQTRRRIERDQAAVHGSPYLSRQQQSRAGHYLPAAELLRVISSVTAASTSGSVFSGHEAVPSRI